MATAAFNNIPWAGLVLAMNGGLVAYQIRKPLGHVTIEYEHLRDGFWEMITNPVIVRRTLDVQLRGELMPWDGTQRPRYVTEPLALPPTPGYDVEGTTRPAIDR